MRKGIIRQELGIKKGGKIQVSSHGAGIYSVQVIRNGKVRENIDLPAETLKRAR